jgi:hypothetical protein
MLGDDRAIAAQVGQSVAGKNTAPAPACRRTGGVGTADPGSRHGPPWHVTRAVEEKEIVAEEILI